MATKGFIAHLLNLSVLAITTVIVTAVSSAHAACNISQVSNENGVTYVNLDKRNEFKIYPSEIKIRLSGAFEVQEIGALSLEEGEVGRLAGKRDDQENIIVYAMKKQGIINWIAVFLGEEEHGSKTAMVLKKSANSVSCEEMPAKEFEAHSTDFQKLGVKIKEAEVNLADDLAVYKALGL